MRRLILPVLVLVVLLAGAGGGYYFYSTARSSTPKYRTAKANRGAIVSTVSATGTLNAVITVQVGSQISGQIKALYADFNTHVKKGQLIARIDPEIFEAKVNQAKAELESAQAAVLNQQANLERVMAEGENARAAVATAQANVVRDTATVANARRELDRRIDLLKKDLISQSEKDTAQTVFDTTSAQLEASRAQERAARAMLRSTEAQLRVAQAQLQSAEANVRQKRAALAQAQVDLGHTFIRAPVDGMVVSRDVDVGQTVAASLQAPVLFTIAQDLTKMQVDTNVDEADVGRVALDQEITFTVDAFPGQTFYGRIMQIRKAPRTIQNVVTYTVVVGVSNPDLKLLPGMTANVKIVTAQRSDALKIPNAALRFRPSGAVADQVAQGSQPQGEGEARAGGHGNLRGTLVKELKLTPEQQAKLDDLMTELRQKLISLRGQQLPERERQAQTDTIRQESRKRIRLFLTEEQRTRFDELVAFQEKARAGETRGRVWILGKDGQPRGVDLVLGITDGSSMEVLRGDLREGSEVIIGMASQPRNSGGRGGGLRLGF